MTNTLDLAVVQLTDQNDLDSAAVAFHCRVCNVHDSGWCCRPYLCCVALRCVLNGELCCRRCLCCVVLLVLCFRTVVADLGCVVFLNGDYVVLCFVQ